MTAMATRVWIESLMGEDVPLGSVLIVYAREDVRIYEDILKLRFELAGIHPFIDFKEINPGDEWYAKLEQAYKRSSCGVPILTPNSITSPWVLYEIGFLCGRGKRIVPYLYTANMDGKKKKKFMDEIPQFIKTFQYSDDPDRIVDTVKRQIMVIDKLFDNAELNKRVIEKLVQLKMTLELEDVLRSLQEALSFGYQIVRFGRWEIQKNEPFNSEIDETDRLHKIFDKNVVQYDEETHRLKIDFIIPIHRRWGTTFKLFVDCREGGLVKDVQQLLIANGLEDGVQSDSGEKQMMYFLLPEKRGLHIVQEPYQNIVVRNNYLFPV
jgi:TIR domain